MSIVVWAPCYPEKIFNYFLVVVMKGRKNSCMLSTLKLSCFPPTQVKNVLSRHVKKTQQLRFSLGVGITPPRFRETEAQTCTLVAVLLQTWKDTNSHRAMQEQNPNGWLLANDCDPPPNRGHQRLPESCSQPVQGRCREF